MKIVTIHSEKLDEQVRQESPDSHLLLTIVYTESGLIEEATKELEELKKANPDSLFAAKLSVR